MASINETLAIGMQHQQAGRWDEAERAYCQILALHPTHPQALHQLGTLRLQTGNFAKAADLFRRTIEQDRSQAVCHVHLGEALRHLGHADQAEACYREALKLQPSLAAVQLLLGIVLAAQGRHAEAVETLRAATRANPADLAAHSQLGKCLQLLGQTEESEACFRHVLRVEQRSPEAHLNLADCLYFQGKLAESTASFQATLALAPNNVDAHNGLAMISKDQGHYDQSRWHYLKIIDMQPDCALAHANLGMLYEVMDRMDDAVTSYRSATRFDSTLLVAQHNLACLLQRQGQLDEALTYFEQVARRDSQNPHAHMALASCLRSAGDLRRALESFRSAVRLAPDSAEAHNNLGVTWNDLGRHDEAIDSYRAALDLRPSYAQARLNLGASLHYMGRSAEALEHYRQAVELDPDNAEFHSNLLYVLNYLPDYNAAALFAEHRAWAQRHADPLLASATPHTNHRIPNRRLRVGYVSPNFRAQAVNFFVEPILREHDRRQFEVFCYSDVGRPDQVTTRLKGYADQWRDVLGQSDEQLSELVRSDQIDILVDLTGHMGSGGRLLAFARKPAPVQVTYIGYQNTTGMLAMDYRLTDDYADPRGLTDAFYTEQLVRLPQTFFCYQPVSDAPPVGPLPSTTNGYVTFASINNFNKITPAVLNTWAAILRRVPDSRLLVRADMTDSVRDYLIATLAGHGVPAARLELVNRLPHHEYLRLIDRVDIALDPFPFNGHTTTCDCLWQGVPVVTLSGTTYASRFGGSGLVTLGLDDLIAHTPDEYIEIAARLAGDRERLAGLRAGLRPQMTASPLMDFTGFSRKLEAEYRRMWSVWCKSRELA